MSNLKVGDEVKIINLGAYYPSYTDMFIKMGFKNISINKLPSSIKTSVFTIFNTEIHPIRHKWLLGLENKNGDQVLINSDGVEKINTSITIKNKDIMYTRKEVIEVIEKYLLLEHFEIYTKTKRSSIKKWVKNNF